jgi:putative ABC transport system permease protein
MYIEQMRKYYGSSDIIIYANKDSTSQYVTGDKAKVFNEQLDYVIGTMEETGYFKPNQDETVTMDLKGFEYEELMQINPVTISEQDSLMPFAGRKIIVNTLFAEKHKLHLGDTMDIEINKAKQRFTISAIVLPSGPLKEDGQRASVIVPKDTIAALNDARGKSSMLYVKVKDEAQIGQMIKALSKEYNRYTVEEPLSEKEIAQQISSITVPFLMMTVLVLFMSVFIIYTSFKVISIERLPVIGTFRSIGATKNTTNFVLMAESLFYGVMGGAFGCILGIGVLYGMTSIFANSPYGKMEVSVSYTPAQLLTAFLLAVILSVISSIIPIMKVSKISVKDIVLNKTEKQSKKKNWKLFWGSLFALAALLLPPFVPRAYSMSVNSIVMILSFVAVVILVPYLTILFIKIFEKAYTFVFGNIGILAAKNLRENKNIINNISLLAIGISSLLMINTITNSVGIEVLDVYGDFNYDIEIYYPKADRNVESSIRAIEGVADTLGFYEMNEVELEGRKDKIGAITGVNAAKYTDYFTYSIEPELLSGLDGGRYIILTNTLKEKFGLKKGDTISLKFKQGNRQYTVLGFFNTLMYNGSYALVPERYLKMDIGDNFYSKVLVKTSGDPDTVMAKMKKKFARVEPYMDTINSMTNKNMDSNAQLLGMMQGFSVMAMVIGVFGVLNNLLISFIERRRSMAVFRSMGMSKPQMLTMIFIESFTGGIIGGISGVAGGLLAIFDVQYVLKAIDLPITMHYSVASFLGALVMGVVVMVVATIGPALRTAKLNIIESIKYE